MGCRGHPRSSPGLTTGHHRRPRFGRPAAIGATDHTQPNANVGEIPHGCHRRRKQLRQLQSRLVTKRAQQQSIREFDTNIRDPSPRSRIRVVGRKDSDQRSTGGSEPGRSGGQHYTGGTLFPHETTSSNGALPRSPVIMTRGWGRVQDPGADRRRPRELANRATMGASEASSSPSPQRSRCSARRKRAPRSLGARHLLRTEDRHSRSTTTRQSSLTPFRLEGRVSVQIHPMSSLVGLSCLAALSLQGGPDGPTYSGTTPRQRLFSSPPSRPQLRRRYRVKAVRRDARGCRVGREQRDRGSRS